MNLFIILLIIHIVGGSTSLLVGLVVLLLRKGDKRHKLLGSIYFYAMLTASLIAIPMSYLHPNYFLFIVSIFTTYMLLTGKRYLYKKAISNISYADWTLTVAMALFSILFIGFGVYNLLQSNIFGIVSIVFGLIGLLFVFQDTINFRGRSKIKNYFITAHIQRFVGSYIAAITAFLVVNNKILPSVVAWLIPTLLLVPFIIKWSRKYKIG